MPLNIGQVLEDRYRIDALLGQGGMGAVYRATDLRFNLPVALKENLQTTQEAQRQFAREAGLLYKLRHPNLPRVSDHFSIPNQGQYLVMDYVEGQDLGQILAQQGAIPEAQALGWIGRVLDALEYLHAEGIVHRDVKPANIKISPKGQVFLVDFGLAKAYDPRLLTTAGARAVTPGFAPPEQYGTGRTDARTDLYSVGATLYALLTGKTPPDALEMVTGQARLVPPRQVNPRVSPQVEAAVLRVMQTRPADRFQGVAEFRSALRTPTPTQPTPAAKATPVPIAPSTVRQPPVARKGRGALPRWFWPVLGGAAVLLVAVGIGVLLLLPGGVDHQATTTPEPGPPVAALETDAPAPRPSDTPPPPIETSAPIIPGPLAAGQIAFQSYRDGNWEIYVMNADGSGQANLTQSETDDEAPTWSPGGRRIAFKSMRDGNWEIHSMNADGSDPVRLTDDPADDWWPAWSPDGDRIAFTSSRDGNQEIYVMNADGSDPVRLTDDPAEDWWPAWSPDGERIAFSSNRDGNREVYVMNADGSGQANLTNDVADDWWPAWSPDGQRIAFTSIRNGGQEIYVMNEDGSGQLDLTNAPADDWWPAWSPDGKRIAFTSNRDGNSEVYVMNADGSGQVNLSNNPAEDDGPAWSPR